MEDFSDVVIDEGERRLDLPQDYSDKFINPDYLFDDPDSVTFVYDNKAKRLYTGPGTESHGVLIFKQPELDIEDYTRLGGVDILYGRMGPVHSIFGIVISFWNPEPIDHPVYRNLEDLIGKLDKFIQSLSKRFPGYEVYLSTPEQGTKTVSQFAFAKPSARQAISAEELRLFRSYHTATGEQKARLKKELQRLGYFARDRFYDPHPWHSAVKQLGYTYPPFTDSFEAAVDNLLEGDVEW